MVSEQTYKKYLLFAQAMASSSPKFNCDKPSSYWNGMVFGIQRAFSGKKLNTEIRHRTFILDKESDSWSIKKYKEGYRDGIEIMHQAKRGRKRKGDASLTRLIVKSKLRDQLLELAEREGVELPELRRRAYRHYIHIRSQAIYSCKEEKE